MVINPSRINSSSQSTVLDGHSWKRLWVASVIAAASFLIARPNSRRSMKASRNTPLKIIQSIVLVIALVGLLMSLLFPSSEYTLGAIVFWLTILIAVVWWSRWSTKPKTPKVVQEHKPIANQATVEMGPAKRRKLFSILFILSWSLVAILIVSTAQAQNERNNLKDQLAVQGNPTINRTLVLEDPQLTYVNAVRAKHGVAPLQYDDGLLTSAKAKTQDMIRRHYWSHITPNGENFNYAVERIRPGLKYYGENIAQCFKDHKEMYKSYVSSPSHFEAMVNPNFTLFGGSTQWDEKAQCYKNTNHFGG